MARLTDRDLDYLALLCRFPFMTAIQLQEWVHGRRDPALLSPLYRRLRGLEERELIVSDRVLQSAPGFLSATRAGMRAVGVTGAVVTAKFSQYRHDLAVVDLAYLVHRMRPDFTLVTEREMRSEDTTNQHRALDPAWATIRPGADSRRRRQFPDLIQEAPTGQRVVHELEMTPKDLRRLRQIMRTYLLDTRVGVIRYWAAPVALERVRAAAEDSNTWARAEDVPRRVVVEPWCGVEGMQ
ncbi:hypothetical protein BRM3_15010 (plasmid) [Brachybacterium huguangmaarense]|uniref:Transcriptional regulator n=1 Tax=Brachybacterium huguangmaarense TaxID=1652028 RepID=A0ABY6G530_9MICO|nr:hypothetical protein [Brachybacterium huguangmaarense]UYG18310.1 hypothetical protein BRM3_15010 [Brachybacterium huguangmaarense]